MSQSVSVLLSALITCLIVQQCTLPAGECESEADVHIRVRGSHFLPG